MFEGSKLKTQKYPRTENLVPGGILIKTPLAQREGIIFTAKTKEREREGSESFVLALFLFVGLKWDLLKIREN